MTHFEELDLLLHEHFVVDQWWEYWIDEARSIVSNFTPTDWNTLNAECWQRPVEWQNRLAQLLDGSEPSRAVPLLLAQVAKGEEPVAYEAICSLNSLDRASAPESISTEVRSRAVALRKKLPDADAEIIEEWLARL
jgi:hypothetical protein